jgi:methanogenic corrinoid protein MtbC1
MKEKLINAIADKHEEEALKLVDDMLAQGVDPQQILDAGKEAMVIVGKRFEDETYFLPELVFTGETLRKIGEIVKPLLQGKTTETKPVGKVVIGTVNGDIHDIGKDIVVFLLDVNNFEVHDLGINVPVEKFVQKIKEVKPEIVGLSGFLTLAFESMRNTIEAIKEAGVRDDVKIMIGGAQMDDKVSTYVGADAFGNDATVAVKLAKAWIGGN